MDRCVVHENIKSRLTISLASALLAVLVACSSDEPPAAAAYWRNLAIEGDEIAVYDQLDELAAASDVVAIGAFADVGRVRLIQGDAKEDQVFMGQFTFVPESEDRGSAEELTVEFLLPTSTLEDAEEYLGETLETPPADPVLLFLHEKRSPGEAGLYRLTSSAGMWIESGGSFYSPLAVDEDAAHDLLHSAGDVDSLEDVLVLAATAVSEG